MLRYNGYFDEDADVDWDEVYNRIKDPYYEEEI